MSDDVKVSEENTGDFESLKRTYLNSSTQNLVNILIGQTKGTSDKNYTKADLDAVRQTLVERGLDLYLQKEDGVGMGNVESKLMPGLNPRQVIVVAQPKSIGISMLLTCLLGPVGMLYSSIPGAIIMGIITLIVGIGTLGFGLIITWPICIIWSAIAANSYNNKLLAEAKRG